MRNLTDAAEAIRAAHTVAICAHINPDGDTVGSVLAMKLVLDRMGKDTEVFCQDRIPYDLMSLPLPGASEVHAPDEARRDMYDLLLALDISCPDMMGDCRALLGRCRRSCLIDHHETDTGYCEINVIDGGAAANCQILPELIDLLGVEITRDIAGWLYVGTATDTGHFLFPNTDSETFSVLSRLMKTGFLPEPLNRILFLTYRAPFLKLLSRAIQSMRSYVGGQLTVMRLSARDYAECGATHEDSEMIVNYGLTVGARCTALAKEEKPGTVRFSLRSVPPFSVRDPAQKLGGGGHSQAAGISLDGSLDETTGRVVRELIACLEADRGGRVS